MGSMAQLGTWDAVVDMDGHTVSVGVGLGRMSPVTCRLSPNTVLVGIILCHFRPAASNILQLIASREFIVLYS